MPLFQPVLLLAGRLFLQANQPGAAVCAISRLFLMHRKSRVFSSLFSKDSIPETFLPL
jgi:hypothetical protein